MSQVRRHVTGNLDSVGDLVQYLRRPLEALLSADKSKLAESFWQTIRKLEARRKSKIFCVIHAADDEGHICHPTLWQTLAERDKFRNLDTLEILLHTPGGSADIAYQVVRFFRRHCKTLNVIVPLQAKSAGTLMCLGADAIYMGEFAELGPIDVQITDPIEKGAKSISPLDEFKSAEFLRDYAVEILDIFTLLIVRRSGMSLKNPSTSRCISPLKSCVRFTSSSTHWRLASTRGLWLSGRNTEKGFSP